MRSVNRLTVLGNVGSVRTFGKVVKRSIATNRVGVAGTAGRQRTRARSRARTTGGGRDARDGVGRGGQGVQSFVFVACASSWRNRPIANSAKLDRMRPRLQSA